VNCFYRTNVRVNRKFFQRLNKLVSNAPRRRKLNKWRIKALRFSLKDLNDSLVFFGWSGRQFHAVGPTAEEALVDSHTTVRPLVKFDMQRSINGS
jgi:hypothetical protein